MKRKRFLALGFIFLLLLICSLSWAAPKISVDTTTYNFGKIKEGSKAKHIFKIINKGDIPLKISKVKTSCGCTGVVIGEKIIDPGKKGNIEVAYNSLGRPGKFTKSVYVYSNDPETPKFTLKITGEVEQLPAPKIRISPRRITLGTIKAGETTHLKLNVSNEGEKDLVLKKICSPGQKIVLWENKEIKLHPGENVTLDVPYKPVNKGEIKERFYLESNDPRHTRYYFFINGKVIQEK